MRVELDVRQPVVLPPGDGDKLLSDELFVSEFVATMDVEPHVHVAHVDSFFVLDGDFTFHCVGEDVALPRETYAVAPPRLVHGFRSGSARVLNVHAPGRYWTRQRLARKEGRRLASAEYDSYDPPDDGGVPRSEAVVARPGECEVLTDDTRRLHILLARPELCVFLFEAGADYIGPSTHVHRQHTDAFYVLEGELAFELEGEATRAPAGTFVAAMPGVAHTFRNATDGPARFVNLHAPGVGFDEYLRRMDAGEEGRAFGEEFDVFEVNGE